jgi:xylulokinase
MPLVLGVDSSTQATKVEVRDADDGRLVASGRAAHPPASPPRSEQDPNAWWEALAAAVRLAGLRDISAMSVAGQQHGLVVLDESGAVLRPAKLWNDTESAPEAAAMVERLGAKWWANACGSVPVASFTVTKLAWLARHERDVFDRAHTLLLPHDFLTHRLTGRFVTDRGDASGTGYWSPSQARWRPDVLERVVGGADAGGWLDRLPEVVAPRDAAGPLTTSALSHLGLHGNVLCAAGTGDNMAAALGIGLHVGDIALSLGTSGTVYTVSEQPTADETGAVAGFADATGRFLPLVCTLNATQVTDAIARLLAVDAAGMDQLALDGPPGADGVVVLPYFNGERTPNLPLATGRIAGVRGNVTRELLARAAFEGVLCGLLDGLDALRVAGVAPANTDDRMVLVGGGARSASYQQIAADLSGQAILVPDADEHVAAGACVQAAAVLHGLAPESVAEAWQLGAGSSVEPSAGIDRAGIRARYAAVRDESA